jgi:TRAP-type uncharacterized transport system substrate-binding protein
MMQLLQRGWGSVSAVARKIGNFQARVILTVFYFTVAAPFALGIRARADFLHLRFVRGSPGWTTRAALPQTVEAARRQF